MDRYKLITKREDRIERPITDKEELKNAIEVHSHLLRADYDEKNEVVRINGVKWADVVHRKGYYYLRYDNNKFMMISYDHPGTKYCTKKWNGEAIGSQHYDCGNDGSYTYIVDNILVEDETRIPFLIDYYMKRLKNSTITINEKNLNMLKDTLTKLFKHDNRAEVEVTEQGYIAVTLWTRYADVYLDININTLDAEFRLKGKKNTMDEEHLFNMGSRPMIDFISDRIKKL